MVPSLLLLPDDQNFLRILPTQNNPHPSTIETESSAASSLRERAQQCASIRQALRAEARSDPKSWAEAAGGSAAPRSSPARPGPPERKKGHKTGSRSWKTRRGTSSSSGPRLPAGGADDPARGEPHHTLPRETPNLGPLTLPRAATGLRPGTSCSVGCQWRRPSLAASSPRLAWRRQRSFPAPLRSRASGGRGGAAAAAAAAIPTFPFLQTELAGLAPQPGLLFFASVADREGRAPCARLATASTMAGGSPYLDESQLRNLKAQYEAQNAVAAAAQIQALVDCVHALKIQVGVLGERGAGVSTLIQALLDKLRRVEDPWAYFREVPQPTKQPIAHTHPTYPNLILQDLPGFEVSEKPAAYLKRLGDLSKYSCFVMVVGGTGLGDAHLQVLKAIKQKGKAILLARTKVDLDLHTAERRLRARYNPAEQLRLIRKELTETLAKNGLDTKKVFLVSGLEAERYEFARFEDSLEGEVLNLKRSHDGNLEDLTPVSQKKMEELYKICQTGSLSEVPAVIQSALEDPVQIRLDVAVIGEAGSGKSSLVNALRGVGSGEPGAAPTGVTETTRKAMAYMLPMVPNLYLWDLPGVGVSEEDVSHLDLSRYDFFLLVASERYKHVHSCLARAIASAGKEAFFVRSKIDVDVEARSGGQPVSKEELQEHVRKSCIEALKKDGIHSPQVFLVSSLMSETYDLPLLQEALRSNTPDLKKKALRRIIPTVLPRLVRRKAKVLMKDVWMKSLQICLYCVERPNPDVAENLIATISSFCIDLGLDEASLVRTAQATGKSARLLQAVVRSPFAKPLTSAYVLSLITKPVPLTSWAWSYVPYLGREAKLEPDVSFESTYGMLQQAVVGLSEDADRVLLAAYTE